MSTEKALVQLPPNEMLQHDFVSTRWDAKIGIGIAPEALLAPAFWAHHAVKLKPMDEIRARAEDGTWVGYYLVLDSSRTWAKVHPLAVHRLTTADVALSQASEEQIKAFKEAHKVVHRAMHKWSVVRTSDGAVLTEGIEQKDQAVSWLDTHARTQVIAA